MWRFAGRENIVVPSHTAGIFLLRWGLGRELTSPQIAVYVILPARTVQEGKFRRKSETSHHKGTVLTSMLIGSEVYVLCWAVQRCQWCVVHCTAAVYPGRRSSSYAVHWPEETLLKFTIAVHAFIFHLSWKEIICRLVPKLKSSFVESLLSSLLDAVQYSDDI